MSCRSWRGTIGGGAAALNGGAAAALESIAAVGDEPGSLGALPPLRALPNLEFALGVEYRAFMSGLAPWARIAAFAVERR